MRLSLLFNPIFRVWTLRILLLWTLLLIVGKVLSEFKFQGTIVGIFGIFGFTCLGTIFVHGVLGVFRWQLKGLAFIDLLSTLLEIAGISYLMHTVLNNPESGYLEQTAIFNNPEGFTAFLATNLRWLLAALWVVELVGVIIIAGFRISTIAASPEPFFRQRLTFLGGCAPAHPPYTPTHILLNRSIARPLVRGESRPILFMRACIIWCIGLGVPIFAIYSIVFMPITTKIYSKYVSPFQLNTLSIEDYPPGNASIFLTPLFGGGFIDAASSNIQVRSTDLAGRNPSDCKVLPQDSGGGVLMQWYSSVPGAAPWGEASNISISLSVPPGTVGLKIVPVTGPNDRDLLGEWLGNFGNTLDGVPLFGGSNLVATFTWTRTSLIEGAGWSFLPPPTTAVYTAAINGFQPLPGGVTSDPTRATLTLLQTTPWVTRQFVDAADTTVLNGIATFGGFWTFLNGAFALFFGANILYFTFGRRPLSALGLVHVFQRRRLKRQWDEDFPAIHTEGGLPGSESAGIIAFIRERLVDLGEDPHEHLTDQADDIEAQKFSGVEEMPDNDNLDSVPATTFQTRAHSEFGYILDEIPLLDIDLGFMGGEILHTENPIQQV
ncbi:hypothetical protein B0H16DRAFT_1482279 [Mycena metata]|uniref:Transmembrane protein n=1 Tax=Mycena metata TaxID=1033252 RepID=A0AAD7GUP1_9AGAR|nr:hypothetical protein B0H16DRAFT_1482279 [Mycena metata]